MEFDLREYNTLEYVMHCPSEEDAVTFLEFLDENGRTWSSKRPYTDSTNWDRYKEETVYYFNDGKFGDVAHAIDCYKCILEFDDFDWEGNLAAPENKELNDFLDLYIKDARVG